MSNHSIYKATALAALLTLLTVASISFTPALAVDPSHTFAIRVHGEPYNVTLTSNSTLSTVTMSNETIFGFNATGTSGTAGFLNVTICKTNPGEFPPGQQNKINVTFDGTPLNATSSGLTRQCLWLFFTYHHSTHAFQFNVSQLGAQAAPTFPSIPYYMLALLIPAVAVPVVLYKKRARA